MLAFYVRLLRRWPHAFRESWERLGFLLDVLIALVLLFNQPLAQAIAQQRGFSAWWFAAPLLLLFVYGLAKTNWELLRERDVKAAADIAAARRDLAVARKSIADNEERHRPKLRFHFAGRVATYYQEAVLYRDDNVQVNDRLFRVGVVNDSTDIIRDVHVLLEGCSSPGGEAIFLNHRLGVMGREQDSVDVSPGAQPTVFFDVVEQQEPIGSSEPGEMFFCYSNLTLRQPLRRIARTFTLLVQGGGSDDRINFQLMRGSDGRIQLIAMSGTAS
jgi:hypothetical protein